MRHAQLNKKRDVFRLQASRLKKQRQRCSEIACLCVTCCFELQRSRQVSHDVRPARFKLKSLFKLADSLLQPVRFKIEQAQINVSAGNPRVAAHSLLKQLFRLLVPALFCADYTQQIDSLEIGRVCLEQTFQRGFGLRQPAEIRVAAFFRRE